jgi:hypothetical protein
MKVTVATAAMILLLSSSFGFECASMGRPRCGSSMRMTGIGNELKCHRAGGVAKSADTRDGESQEMFLSPSQRLCEKRDTSLGKVSASEVTLSTNCGVGIVKVVIISPF